MCKNGMGREGNIPECSGSAFLAVCFGCLEAGTGRRLLVSAFNRHHSCVGGTKEGVSHAVCYLCACVGLHAGG